ncbi:MAG: polyprenyl synthetase family protein [Bacteroidetes bacterium]|nr:polyprenyl synthetase family protein [Bacteroidota bacterium]
MVTTPQMHYEYYKNIIERYLRKHFTVQKPRSLYQPSKYVMSGGGKRLRPVLVLLANEAVGGNAIDALPAAVAIEVLHNFTLVHDDIMDHAPSRRGRMTVHVKWDESIAILTGDVLLALAYRHLLGTKSPRIHEIVQSFTNGVITICEGQALDKEFETRSRVYVNEYITMIEKKTGKLFSVSMEIGAIIGSGKPDIVTILREYGTCIGRAFQLQDDLLDIVGDEKEFGKAIGSDLQEGKRTFLLLEAMRRAKGKQKEALKRVFERKVQRREVEKYRKIYEETGAISATHQRLQSDFEKARSLLMQLPDSHARQTLLWLTEKLIHRTY